MPRLFSSHSWRHTFLVVALLLSSGVAQFSPQFTKSVSADIVDNPTVTDCYTEFNNLAITSYDPKFSDTSASGKMWKKCKDSGYCTTTNLSTGVDQISCNEGVDDAVDKETILNAQVGPLITVICGEGSTNTSLDAIFAECSKQVKVQYVECRDISLKALNHGDDEIAAIASCMQSWVKTTYPDKTIRAAKIKDAVKEGIDDGSEKDEEIATRKEQEAEKVCTDQGLTYSPDADGADADGCVGASTTCTGGSLGWILCPLTDMMSSMIASLTDLIDGLLTYEPLLITTNGATPTQGQVLQSIWSVVVRIANILLVIAFMVVIFSQATSIGLSAYGIKKMLPRIIAAAILINLSFFICAIAVDITNIAGASIQGIIQSAIGLLPNSDATVIAAESWNVQFVLLTGTLVAASAVTGAIFYIFPFLLTAALTLLTAFILLAARQIVITLLIIVAPLAFAAFVLPNTESLFKKWQKLFTTLLLMYPLIMTIFYGSNFMSHLILATKANKSSANEFFTDIIAFAMLFVPLFILPTLMKLSGGILERIGGIINDREKGLIDRSRNWAGGRQKQQMQDLSNRKVSWLQQNRGKGGIRGLAAGAGNIFDPSMQKIRRDEWSRQYDEAAKLASARTASRAISNSMRASDLQKARAQATLDEIDMKQAKIKLDYQFNSDPSRAIAEALRTNDSALLKLSAGKFTDTAQLGELQRIMSTDARIGDTEVASIGNYLKEHHFAKVKEQDLGMMYAMTDPGGLTGGSGKAELAALMAGGSRYDTKAMGASDAAIGGQEKYVLDRQSGWDDASRTYSKPVVLDPVRAERILDDPNLKGQIKEGQRDILAAATVAGSPHHKAHP